MVSTFYIPISIGTIYRPLRRTLVPH